MADFMIRFADSITTPSFNKRKNLFFDLNLHLDESGIKKEEIAVVFKQFARAIAYLTNLHSFRLVRHVLERLVAADRESCIACFVKYFKTSAEAFKKAVSSCKLTSTEAFFSLKCSCILLEGPGSEDIAKLDTTTLMEQQAVFFHATRSNTSHPAIVAALTKFFTNFLNKNQLLVPVYLRVLASAESSATFQAFSLVGFLLDYVKKASNGCQGGVSLGDSRVLAEDMKKAYLGHYIESVLKSKVKVKDLTLTSLTTFLTHLNDLEFGSEVMPTINKALLRNPEITFVCLRQLIETVSIDLSQHTQAIGKHLLTQCFSKDDKMHTLASQSALHLSRHCSNHQSLQDLLNHFFTALTGPEGKAAMAEQKMALITCIGNCSAFSLVDGNSTLSSTNQLVCTVSEKFVSFIQSEGHEAVCVHAILQLIGWSSNITSAIPEPLLKGLQNVLTNKNSSSNIRVAILKALHATLNDDTKESFSSLLPCLNHIIQTAITTASVQHHQVLEGLLTSLLLLSVSCQDPQLASQQTTVWNMLLDCNKQHLCNHKFLSQGGKDDWKFLSSLILLLFTSYPHQLQHKHVTMYSECLVECLLKGDHHTSRKTLGQLKRLSSAPPSHHPDLPTILANSASQVLHPSKTSLGGSEDHSSHVDHRLLYLLYQAVVEGVAEGAGEVAVREMLLHVLVPVHHPFLVSRYTRPWLRLCGKVSVQGDVLVKDNLANVFEPFLNTLQVLTPDQQNALVSLAEVAPKETFQFVRRQITPIYTNQSYLSISHLDHALLTWPEGELFDKSIIDSFTAASKDTANMRRENKLYSYEEQMAELELRKELASKGRGKVELKLSKKQQEMLQTQLDKETATRGRLQQLQQDLLYANSLLEGCIQGSSRDTRQLFVWLLPLLHKLCKSVMASTTATCFLKRLAFVALDEDDQQYLALTLANCTLRHLKPQCELDPNWTQESLTSQSERLIDELFTLTGCSLDRHQSFEQPLFTPSFHYASFFVQSILRTASLDDDWLLKCLALISCHAKQRASTPHDGHSPYHLPLHSLITLCLHMIGASGTPVRQHAQATLLDLARASSGGQGCASIGHDTLQELLDALLSPVAFVRKSSLEALEIVKEEAQKGLKGEQQSLWLSRLWLAMHDVQEENCVLAARVYEDSQPPAESSFFNLFISYVVHHQACVRSAASAGLSAALQHHQLMTPTVLQQLLQCYEEKLYIPPVPKDEFGRVVQGFEQMPDDFQSRCGIGLVVGSMAPLYKKTDVEEVVRFVVHKGLLDRHPQVQQQMLQTGISIIGTHGKENMDFLFSLFEDFLTTAPATATYDTGRQGVAILMGTLAKHLSADSEKLKPIVARLITTLSTPSEEVQSAVANCLHPLVTHLKSDAADMARSMLQLLFTSDDYGQRRGAAYGLAGLVKGLGILSLKQLDIITELTTAIQDKKNPKKKEGALFAFEMLCKMLERLFEPYVVHLLPHLLTCFGDPSQNIRDAADDTAKMVMSKLSGHGVKLVLPSLLTALEEDSWRTKSGSVELLGAMAYCAPKQLSACLPSIVPKLTEVLTDSHIKVQKSGSQALSQIGAVIRNPEIQAVVPVLLRGIQDPVAGTTKALEKLLATKFVHFIDAPSLALIMPVVQRALTDRSSDTRKMAAQIIANMYSLTDQKDLSPYLPTMVPGLKESLLSPMPEVRAASARAFGTMVKSMGEKGVGDLLPWLFDTLTSEGSTVDRSGAAQGLAEVVGGLGLTKLNEMMPDVIETTSRTDINPSVRDGYIMLYIYLPPAFGDHFIPYVGPIIPTILQALADETEFVRDTALRAGQKIVQQYADTAIELLLPEVEKGLFDDNWRIRYSSIHLMGDLLFRISGVTGKMSTQGKDEDDNFGTEASQKAILRALGTERFNRVFSGLYVCRHGSSLVVRQAALHVWKVIVSHTPRTLRDIMPTLFNLLLHHLASSSYDKRQMAALTLGDIVKKLGEKVLPEIMPILEEGLLSDDSEMRQGVCFGLCEIINSTGHDHVVAFAGTLIPTIRKALMDDQASVREAASHTFDTLHSNLGVRCIDDILPSLLEQLQNPAKSDQALDGLRQVINVKGRVVLPHLIPSLTADPVNSRALSFLASAAGDALHKHLSKILLAMVRSLATSLLDASSHSQELEHSRQVILSLHEDDAVQHCIDTLLEASSPGAVERTPLAIRQAALEILTIFCSETKVDYGDHVIRMVKSLIMLSAEEHEPLLHASWDCLAAIVKKVEPVNMVQHMSQMRQALRLACVNLPEDSLLPGLCLPKKGIAPLVLVFREAILTGSSEIKESATVGLTEAIRRSSPEALKHSVINITGALIRILGERFGFNVKVAMLESAGLLLKKCGVNMKAFLPQLQTTFLKTLNDSNKTVRLRSATAIGSLVDIHNRIDPLFNELIGMIKSADDLAIKASVIQATRLCLTSSNCKLQEKTQKELLQTLRQHSTPSTPPSTASDAVSMVASACIGVLCARLQEDLLQSVISSNLLDTDASSSWSVKLSRSTSLSVALKQWPACLFQQPPATLDNIAKNCIAYAASDKIPTKLRGVRCLTYFIKHQLASNLPVTQSVVDALLKTSKSDSSDVKQACCSGISHLGVHCHDGLLNNQQLLLSLVSCLLLMSKERLQVVRLAAEHTLISLLCLRNDESIFQQCLDSLSTADKDCLIDVSNKSLKRLKLQEPPIEEDFDNTFI